MPDKDKDKRPPPPQPLRTFLNLTAAPDPAYRYDPNRPPMQPYVPTKGQRRAQAGLMGLADLVRGLTIGASDEKDSNAAQIGELIQTGIPFLKSLGLAGGLIHGGLQVVGEADDVARGLYSRVDEALKLIPAKGAHPNKVATLLKSNGATAEELAYRKVPEFLASKGNATVTPAELAAHLAEHPAPMPKVVTRGGDAASDAQAHVKRATDALKTYLVSEKHFSPTAVDDYILTAARGELAPGQVRFAETDPQQWALMEKVREAYEHRATTGNAIPTKYESYQVPGGENYRETLSTLPERPPQALPPGYSIKPVVGNPHVKFTLETPDGSGYALGAMTEEQAYPNALAVLHDKGVLPPPQNFRSGHFDEPNVLVHTRSNERTLPTGEPGHFIEEVQSDWHQKGKKEGYGKDTAGWTAKLLSEPDAGFTHWQVTDAEGNYVTKIVGGTEESAIRKAAEGGVPDAPFKESWPDLGLKQQVLEAANDPNAQWIGHTSGQTQAARYDLSKQISNLRISPTQGTPYQSGGPLRIEAFDHSGTNVMDRAVTPQELPDYIGKEMADKVRATGLGVAGQEQVAQEFSGLDLQVGGEGMRHFYDRLLPKRLEKILKPFGGTVERGAVPTGVAAHPTAADMVPITAEEAQRTGAPIFEAVDAEFGRDFRPMRSDALGQPWGPHPDRLFTTKPSYQPGEPAWIARLTPEMKARIRREGLPLLSLLGMGALWQAPQEAPENRQ